MAVPGKPPAAPFPPQGAPRRASALSAALLCRSPPRVTVGEKPLFAPARRSRIRAAASVAGRAAVGARSGTVRRATDGNLEASVLPTSEEAVGNRSSSSQQARRTNRAINLRGRSRAAPPGASSRQLQLRLLQKRRPPRLLQRNGSSCRLLRQQCHRLPHSPLLAGHSAVAAAAAIAHRHLAPGERCSGPTILPRWA